MEHRSVRFAASQGISDATFYNWRKKYAGLMPSEMKRIVADLSLTRPCSRMFCQKSSEACPQALACRHSQADWKVSIRRACSVLKIDWSLYVYKSTRGEGAELKLKIRDVCQTRLRYGYRRVHVLLRRDGGLLIRSESIVFTKRWTSSSAIRSPSVGSTRSCEPTAPNRPILTMSGPWTSYTTNWLPAVKSGF